MTPKRWILGLGGLLAAGTLMAYSGGAPNGYAGDPPAMNNCTACHSTFPVNSGDGTLSLAGLPETYVPESTYTLQVILQDPGQSRWGFELTVIDEAGNQGGVLEAVDGTVQISEGPGNQRDYAKQTSSGTFNGQSSATWSLRWTAPPAGTGPVTFYVAGNAANGNFSTSGDYIYTLSSAVVTVEEADTSPRQGALPYRLYPNPLHAPRTVRIQGLTGPPGQVQALVLDSSGRLATLLTLEPSGAGRAQGYWNGKDLENRPLKAGTYWLHIPQGRKPIVLPLLWLP